MIKGKQKQIFLGRSIVSKPYLAGKLQTPTKKQINIYQRVTSIFFVVFKLQEITNKTTVFI